MSLPSGKDLNTPSGVSVVVVDQDLHVLPSTLDCDEKAEFATWDSQYQTPDVEFGSIYGAARPPTRWSRAWVSLRGFFRLRFANKDMERDYQDEDWVVFLNGPLLCSLFLVLFWALSVVWVPHTSFVYKAYFAAAGVTNLPLPFFVLFNLHKRVPWLYQLWLAAAAWSWGVITPAEMTLCHFFGNVNHCGAKTFMFTFASLVMHPTLALLLLGQNRVVHITAATAWLIYGSIIFMTQPKIQTPFIRNLIILELYHIFLAVMSYARERTLRQLFFLRCELKQQCRNVLEAQALERKADESKKRFVSYIFHEVRVPLNTAILSTQNLEAEGVFGGITSDHRNMVDGLEGSLDMMEKVLNDVLSFNRMEEGNLEQARRPFDFHKAINLVALSHRAHAEHAGLAFGLELDPRIDDVGGIVLGDEMRLRQVTSNLVSNALKFTRQGAVRIVTKLAYTDKRLSLPPSSPRLSVTQADTGMVAIRVEVHDSGVGLAPEDLQNNRLFSPYVQTEIGRRQGGKGSGLGLALVQQIVKLSGGRLGVDSTVGKGSVFWFEIPYSLEATGLLPRDSLSFSPPLPIPLLPPLTRTSSPPSVDVRTVDEGEPSDTLLAPIVMPATDPLLPAAIAAPTYPAEAKVTKMPSTPGPLSPRGSLVPPLSILVVDDDALTRMLMGRMLGRLGHQVAYAENGCIALERIRAAHGGSAAPLDIVFLDNQMPIMSGIEVVQEVRAMGCTVRVVGCTGNALEEDQLDYIAAGADVVCAKPVRHADILRQLAMLRGTGAGTGTGAG